MSTCLIFILTSILIFVTLINTAVCYARNLNVLVVFSHQKNMPADNIFENNLFKHFVPSRASKVEYFFEYIDFTRFPMSDKLLSFFDFLRKKYRSTPLDLIITVNNPAFDFILKNSHDPFFQVPIIFSRLTENKLEIASTLKNASMLIEDIDIIGNIDLVLKIHPDLRRLIFITDFSSEGLYQESRIKSLLKEYDNKYEIILLKPSREKSLTQQIENISGQAAIFYFPCRLGAFGEHYMPMDNPRILNRARPWAGLFLLGSYPWIRCRWGVHDPQRRYSYCPQRGGQ